MRIRVFASEDRGLVKCFNFLRMSSDNGLQVFFCDPLKWLPPAGGDGAVADLHLYIDVPVRMAWPFARFNVVAVPDRAAAAIAWLNEPGVVDLFVHPDALQGDSKRALITLRTLMSSAQKKGHDAALPQSPPKGTVPPKIAIITATGGRAAWWSNMVQNVTGQAWPVSRLEWIIVDDEGDDNLADLVTEFRERAPGLVVRYKSVPATTTIGAKRNLACRLASADVSVFAVMDDDDHYPANSLSTRASWLLRREPTDIVYCSTLPMYDIRKYVSAMNVPPLTEAPTARVSEATLLFTRAAWEAQPFPESSMGEGAGFLEGRIGRTVEIGPADVIVSFIHGGNTSSRRTPAAQEPNGCHYGFSDDYFRYLHEKFGDATKTDS